jgi:hypothetical protein
MPDVFSVADILIDHAVRVYKDDIAIVAYSGSYARGTASATSDLDIFFIPDDGKARSLSSQFVIDGLPYDFWAVPWKFAEDIANARGRRPWAVAAAFIADARVLYHRSQADLDRFNALKTRIAELLDPQSRQSMVDRALDAFKNTLFCLGQVRLAAAAGDAAGKQWAALKLVNSAVNCLALVNQVYFSKGWGANFSQVLEMANKPAGLEQMIKATLNPGDSGHLLEEADKLVAAIRDVLLAAQLSVAEPVSAQNVFAGFYYYVLEYKQKVLSACVRGDAVAAGISAAYMQEQICQLMNKVDQGFFGRDFNLLGEYLAGYEEAGFPDLLEPAFRADLAELADRVRRLDEEMRSWLERHAIDLNILDSEEDLRRFLASRAPT